MATKAKHEDEITAGGAVEINGQMYTPGMEKELADVITAEHVEHLTRQGAIRGFEGAPSAKAREAAAKKQKPAEAGQSARRASRESLASQIPAGAAVTGDEAAEMLGGTPAGEPGPGVKGNTSKDRSLSSVRDPEKMTVAELGEALGPNVPEKGSGSNGQVTRKDLIKAYKKQHG